MHAPAALACTAGLVRELLAQRLVCMWIVMVSFSSPSVTSVLSNRSTKYYPPLEAVSAYVRSRLSINTVSISSAPFSTLGKPTLTLAANVHSNVST